MVKEVPRMTKAQEVLESKNALLPNSYDVNSGHLWHKVDAKYRYHGF
jgi:hypothetical protein